MLIDKRLTVSLLLVSAIASPAFGKKKLKDYENFSLPSITGAKSFVPAPIPPGGVNASPYLSDRVQIRRVREHMAESKFNRQQFMFAKAEYLAEKTDEAIKLIRQEMDAGYKRNRDNMLLRLGQLYAEKYMQLSFVENEVYTEQMKEFEKKHAVDKKLKPPAQDTSRSTHYLKDSLAIFYSLEREYPKHPRMDEIVFFIGFVEMENGNGAKGSAYLERLIRNYPKSGKFEDAVVYLGDYYFEKHNFKAASDKYRILLARNSSSLFYYAKYKIAWCELNMNAQPRALADMKWLVQTLAGTTDKAKFNLREQAIKDLVVFYGEVGDVDGAIAFFTDVLGRDKALENLRVIADILRSKGRDVEAVKAYSRLLDENPNSLEAPRLAMGIYDCEIRLGHTKQAVDKLAALAETYGTNSAWAKSFPPEKQKEVKVVLAELEDTIQRAAYFFHAAAQKSSNVSSYDFALRLYTAILRNFPDSKEKKKIAFYRGEILFTKQQWLEASNSYMIAAKILPKDKLNDECVYNALLALDRLTAKNETLQRYSKEDQKNVDVTPKEIPSEEKRFIEIANYYLQEYPQGARVVDVRFRIASIYYRYHHFDEALAMFNDIALKSPRHRSAVTSADLALDIYNIKKDYESLDAQAQLFAKTPGLGDAAFRTEMAEISSQIGFKKVEKLEQANKWKEAGDSYYHFYQASPTSPLAEKALYNAVVSYQKSGDSARTLDVTRQFVSKYPKSQYTEQLTLGLAKNAEQNYDFDQAQRAYYEFYKKYPGNREAHKALYNAAVFAELLEMNKPAISLYNEYLKQPDVSAQEKTAIQISQAKIYRKEGDFAKMALIYRRLARDAKNNDEKLAYLGELTRQYERAGKTAEKEQMLNQIKWLYRSDKDSKPTGAGVQYAAEAEFLNVDKQREKFESIQLRFPAEDLLYLIKRKEKALKKLAAAYDGVVEVGVPEWGVAALQRKGEAYDDFVTSFRKVQVPAKYKGEMQTEAEQGLKQIDASLVAPLEKTAQDIYKICATKANQFHVTNEYAMRCRSALKKTGNEAEPSGLTPQPAYWSTRILSDEVAQSETKNE